MLWAQDQVDQHAWKEEHCHHEHCQNADERIARPRADGYHPLESVVAFADVGDIVEAVLSLSRKKIAKSYVDLRVDVPESLRGAPITLITAGLLALAFMGFAGII